VLTFASFMNNSVRITALPLALAVLAFPGTVIDGQASYNGARSGTFEYHGAAIPQNAEYIFRNVPLVKLRLDYDEKIWSPHLAPSDGQTQRLIVKNISNGPQKHCVVHWTVSESETAGK
jgi:hypothetical protein